jgi:hypothetical protein
MRVHIRFEPKYSQKEMNGAIDAALEDQSAHFGLDQDVEKLLKESKITGKELRVAWQKYCNLFGAQPRGTEKQLSALLELVPARVRKEYR